MNEKAESSSSSKRSRGRRVAEWVSLGISVALILATAVYLVYQGLRSHTPFIPIEVHVHSERATQVSGRYVLPMTVENRGHETIRDVRIDIRYRPPGGEEQQDFTIDYLGERSEQRIYIYLDHDPRTIGVEAKAVQYRLD